MGKGYPYPTIWVGKIMTILHIYGAKTNFLLFCDHQDTESESQEIEVVVLGLIFTQKNIKGPMGQRYPYFTIC